MARTLILAALLLRVSCQDEVPNFVAETQLGKISFHNYIEARTSTLLHALWRSYGISYLSY